MPSYAALPNGAIVTVRGPASLARDGGRNVISRATLTGRRKVQLGPRRRRSWDVRLPRDATPEDIAVVESLAEGEFSDDFYWMDVWAQRTNLLTPDGTDFTRMTPPSGTGVVGPEVLPDGTLARPLQPTAAGAALSSTLRFPRIGTAAVHVPVRPGQVVTGSAWAKPQGTAAARIRLIWVLSSGSTSLGDISAAEPPGYVSGQWHRAHVTGTTPADAVGVLLAPSTGCRALAKLAVTYTGTLFPWMPGQAAARAIIEDPSIVVSAARPDAGGQRASVAFRVLEVG